MNDYSVTFAEYWGWCEKADWAYVLYEKDSDDSEQVNLSHKIEYFSKENRFKKIYDEFVRYHKKLRDTPPKSNEFLRMR